jgi:hypothetical protein
MGGVTLQKIKHDIDSADQMLCIYFWVRTSASQGEFVVVAGGTCHLHKKAGYVGYLAVNVNQSREIVQSYVETWTRHQLGTLVAAALKVMLPQPSPTIATRTSHLPIFAGAHLLCEIDSPPRAAM